jgi:hypothetical protein
MQPDGTFTVVVGAEVHAGRAVTGAPVPGHIIGVPLEVVAVVVVPPVAVVDAACVPVEVTFVPVAAVELPPPPVVELEEEQPASMVHATRSSEAFDLMASFVVVSDDTFQRERDRASRRAKSRRRSPEP